MNPNPTGVCEKCGTTIAGALGGLCPRCLIQGGLEPDRPAKGDTTRIINPLFVHQLGDYELLEEVARGGMGVVYKARQRSLGRVVAVKVLSAGEFASKEFVQRFKSEASAAARLRHPNIVVIHEVGEQDGVQYFSMDYVDGPNLADYARACPLESRRAAGLLKTLAEAVEYAHRHGILHRDLKPSNVLIDPFGEPRITDFGLAKELTGKGSLTATGEVVGTPGYMPPEQADSSFGPTGPACDVYSLGAILYFMLTGRAPFVAGSLHETLRQVFSSDPVPPRTLNPEAPRDLDTICLKCLEKHPARRYQSARELVGELERFMAGEPTLARPIGWPELLWRWCRKQPALAALAAVVPVLLITLSLGATATAVYIAAARDAEAKERARAEHTVNLLELQRAEDMLRDNMASQGLAYLSDVLRKEPTNRVAATRIASVLMQRNFPLPVCPPIRHGAAVNRVAYSPDGRTVASAGLDGVVRLWSAATGQPQGPLMRHDGAVFFAAFSPDGRRLYTASADGTARRWDTASGKEIGPALEHESEVMMAELSRDGRGLLTVTRKYLRLWDVETGRLLGLPIDHGGRVLCTDMSADRGLVAAGGNNFTTTIWNVRTGRPIVTLRDSSWVEDIEFTPDGTRLLSCTYDGRARLWEIATGKMVFEVRHRLVLSDLAIAPDGKRFATVSWDGDARIWDLRTGESLVPPMPHRVGLSEVSFSPDGRKLLTRGLGNTAWIWDAATGAPWAEPIQHSGRIGTVQFSPDSQSVATGSADGTVMLWDIRPGRQAPLTFPQTDETASIFSPDGTRLLTWGQNGVARVWDARTGSPVTPPMRHADWIATARFSADGARVVTASLDRTAAVWDAASGKRLARMTGHENGVDYAEFSPDGRTIVTASRDTTAAIWNAATGERIFRLTGHSSRLWQARYSPDGRWVVTASRDGAARVWSAATGAPAGPPLLHDAEIFSAAFDQQSRRIVTASMDMTARVWDVASGRLLARPLKHEAVVRHAEFSPDGKRVLTVSGDNTARFWDAETGLVIGQALQHQGGVGHARFSADGAMAATASDDGTARLWDGFTGQPLTEPLTRGGRVTIVSLTPNKRWLAAGDATGDAFVWEIPEMGAEPPAWLPDLAEAVARKRVSETGFEFVSPEELNRIRAEHLLRRTGTWERFLRWFFDDRSSRTISPSSTVTVPQELSRLIQENSRDSLREALTLDPASHNPRLSLARMLAVDPPGANPLSRAEDVNFRRWVLDLPEGEWALAEGIETTNPAAARQSLRRLQAFFPTNAAFHTARGRIAARLGELEEARSEFESALQLASSPRSLSRALATVGRRNVLLRLGQRAEAEETPGLPLHVPPRAVGAGRDQIDLAPYYNALPDEPWHDVTHPGNTLRSLPRGLLPLGDSVFDVRGVIQLASLGIHGSAPGYPPAVRGIPIGRLCRRIHFLHATGWGAYVAAGSVIGNYRLHYADGVVEKLPIVDGEDLYEWLRLPGSKTELKRARVVWEGKTPQGDTALLYERTWENPRPGREILTLDFDSSDTVAAPFLVAVTTER